MKTPALHLHTKILLNYLERARACGGAYSPSDSKNGPFYTIDELKAALRSRPHVPNKPEAKEVRRQKQWHKKHR